MKKIFILISVIILPFASCKKDNTSINSSGLIGEWSWIKTCGGLIGGCYTPADNIYTLKLSFGSDYVEEIYKNDSLIGSNKFTLRNDVIHIDNSLSYTFKFNADTLVMTTLNVTDLWTSTYKRIK